MARYKVYLEDEPEEFLLLQYDLHLAPALTLP